MIDLKPVESPNDDNGVKDPVVPDPKIDPTNPPVDPPKDPAEGDPNPTPDPKEEGGDPEEKMVNLKALHASKAEIKDCGDEL